MKDRITIYERRPNNGEQNVLGAFGVILRLGGMFFQKSGYDHTFQSTISRETVLEEVREKAKNVAQKYGIEYGEQLIDWNPKPNLCGCGKVASVRLKENTYICNSCIDLFLERYQ